MEQKLNIAEILKNKPRGTKLYSMIHGKCSSEAVTDEIIKRRSLLRKCKEKHTTYVNIDVILMWLDNIKEELEDE